MEFYIGRFLPIPFDRLISFATYNYNKIINTVKKTIGVLEKVYLITTMLCVQFIEQGILEYQV